MRSLLSVVVGLSITMFAVEASAYGTGATGFTGKQAGQSCNSCHNGGTAPQVMITGPDKLEPGKTGDYQMVVMTAQSNAGGGVAATDGVTLIAGTGLKLDKGELTHPAPAAVAAGAATFSFKVTAPAAGTTLKLYAVGLASNGTGTAGDKATQITKDIAIMAATAPDPTNPDAGTTPAPATGEQANETPGSATTSKDSTEPADKSTGSAEESGDDDDDDDDDARTNRAKFNAASCNLMPGNVDPAGAGAAGAVLLGLALLGRRRRR